VVSPQRLSRGDVLDRPEGSYISTGLTVADTNRVPRDQLQGLAMSMGIPTPAQLATVAGYSNTFFLTTGPVGDVTAGGPAVSVIPTSPQPRQPGWAAPIRLARPDEFRDIARADGTPGLIALFKDAISGRSDLAHLEWEDIGTTWDLYSSSGDSADQARGFGSGRLMWAVPLGPSPTPAEIQPAIPPEVLEFVALPESPSPFAVRDIVVFRDQSIDDRTWFVTAINWVGIPDPHWTVNIIALGPGAEDRRQGVDVDHLRAAVQPPIPPGVLEFVALPESTAPFEVGATVYYRNQLIDDRPWFVNAVRQTGSPDPFWVADITSLRGAEDFRESVNVYFLVERIAPGLEFEPTIGDLSEVAIAISAVPLAVAQEVGPIIAAGSSSILSVLGDLGGLIEGIEIPDLLATFPGLATLGEFLANPLEYVLTRGGEITISPDISGPE